MKRIVLSPLFSEEDSDALGGTFLSQERVPIQAAGNVMYMHEDGRPLLILVKGVIPREKYIAAANALRSAAKKTDNRGMAAGGNRYRNIRSDGTRSKTNRAHSVNSGIVGFYDRYPRVPYCRMTAFTMGHLAAFNSAIPFFQAIGSVFESVLPERFAAQKRKSDDTNSAWVIPGTPFTTVTVNRNFRTAIHKDVGDLREGFGCIAVVRSGMFGGCFFGIPRYGVCADIRNGDVLLADVHEWHGNTAVMAKKGANWERLSFVCYYREKMIECGTPAQELERAKVRKEGDPLRGRASGTA